MKSGMNEIGPETAVKLINGRACHPNSNIFSAKRVKEFAELMQTGEWESGSKIILTKTCTGCYSLIDGRHRMRAVLLSGTTQVFEVVIINSQLKDLYKNAKKSNRESRLVKLRLPRR